MLYIISEIKKSLFYFFDTQVCPLTCAFLTPSKEREEKTNKQYSSLLLWIQNMRRKEKQKTALIRKSLFFLSCGS